MLVEDMNFDNILVNGQPDDLDPFGRMLLIARLGIDEVRGWFDFKGGRFEQDIQS